jgi:hypothetical protein
VERVLRTSDGATARHSRLPDLVVHWVEGRGDRPVETDGRVVVGALRGTEMTGQHAPEGVLIARAGGGRELALPSEVAAEELGGLIERMLTAS